jgi:hypothetical protein
MAQSFKHCSQYEFRVNAIISLYQIVDKEARFPELPHVITVFRERIAAVSRWNHSSFIPNWLQLRYKIYW